MVSLLGGGIAAVFGAAFGGLYLDGFVRRDASDPIYADDGSITGYAGGADVPCKVQVDAASHAMRQAEGFVDGDVRLIVLTHSLGIDLTTDHRVAVGGKVYLVMSCELDAPGSHWLCRGRPA